MRYLLDTMKFSLNKVLMMLKLLAKGNSIVCFIYKKKNFLFKFIILIGCDNMLENLRKEKELFMDNISARQEVVNVSEQLVEINEPYDEAEEAAWNGKVLS